MKKNQLFFASFAFSLLLVLWTGITQFYKINNTGQVFVPLITVLFSLNTFLKFIVAFGVSYGMFYLLNKNKTLDFIYRFRYLLALLFLIIGVTFELSGSSIGVWGNYLNSNEHQQVLLGMSRQIRSDEWATSISFIFAQGRHTPAFPYFNELIRATATDMFIVSGSPVVTLGILFKPAFIGYILLGISKGLSFYWIFRFFLLFLSLFELGMLLTEKNKTLSLMLTSLITFSSVVQWWFVAAGLVEMISVGAIAVILIDKYLSLEKQYWKKILISLLLCWCAITYALTLYPAWQVPVAYIYLAILIHIVIKRLKTVKLTLRQDGVIIVSTIFIVILTLLLLLLPSLNHIRVMTNTVYPGSRFEVGGGASHLLSDYPYSIFYSMINVNSERFMDLIYDFFPFGFILSIFVYWKTRDVLLLSLLSVASFFLIYVSIGIPSLLAQITMMSISASFRVVSILGIVNILLLIRSLAIYEIKIKRVFALLLAFIGSSALSFFTYRNGSFFFDVVNTSISDSLNLRWFLVISSWLVLISLLYFIFRRNLKRLLLGVFALSFLTGVTVNPVQKGVAVVEQSNIVKTITRINKEDKGKWLVDNLMFPNNNIPLLAGVETINSTSVYPNLEAWEKVDTEHRYEDIYNRFAHVNVQLTASSDFNATLIAADSVFFSLPARDLKTLNIKFILTNRNLEAWTTDGIEFELLSEVDGFKIYRIYYSS